METETALVRTDGIGVLHTVAHIGLHLALVVDPCDAEGHYTVGHAEALNEVGSLKLGVLVILIFDGGQHFCNGLKIELFTGEVLSKYG